MNPRGLDPVSRNAWITSTLLHFGILGWALLGIGVGDPSATTTSDDQLEPTPPPPAEERQIEMLVEAIASRSSTDDATLPEELPPLPPLDPATMPALDADALPEPRAYHHLAEESNRNLGNGGAASPDLATSSTSVTPLLDDLQQGAGRLTDELVDRRRQEWQLVADAYQWLNQIQKLYRERWRPRFGELVTNTRLVILVEMDQVQDLHFRGIQTGSGCAELDQALATYLRSSPPTQPPPTKALKGLLPLVVHLEGH